jgi:5-methylcytosine-specific restriction protein B
VALTRRRLGHGLEAFESAEGFSYHTWSSGHFPWTTKSSRAVARQLEQFISFRQDAANVAQEAAIESHVGKALIFLDQNLHLLKPIPDFGKGIIQEYYSENLPELATPTIDSTTLTELVASLDGALGSDEVGVHAKVELIHRVASCLLSKRFLIATGLAGSGKTKLAQAFARWLSTPVGCYEVVPVGADWTGNENVLGYPNGLDGETYISKPALDLVVHAKEHQDVPHFLILDEMNLSHVERYFADILSVIESEEEIQLYDGAARQADGKPIPSCVELPKNMFIIGTVNVDETTYMFSPKVLDRANVIEFRMDAVELEGFLGNPAKPDLSKLDGKGASFGKAFVDAAKNPVTVPSDVKAAYDAEMLLLFKTLQAHGAEFGYRTAYETARFIHFYKLLGNHADGDTTWFPGAFDCVVFQKLLPKLHGSRAKLGPVLKKLWFLCVNDAVGRGADALKAAEEAARSTDKKAEPSVVVPAGAPYPLSAEKIGRMWRLLIENGFASFAEA